MSELMNDLFPDLDAMNEATMDGQAEQLTAVIDDDMKAERLLDYIRWANGQKKSWADFYSDRLDKIYEEMDRKIEWARQQLKAYFWTVPHKKAKASESYPLKTGKLVIKRQQPQLTPDNDALIQFLLTNKLENFVKTETVTTTKPLWGEFRKTLAKDPTGALAVVEMEDGLHPVTDDGVPVDCVAVEMRPDKFEVEVN